MTLIQVLRILWARRRLFVLLLALVVGAVMAASLLAPRKYVAQAALLIDTRGNEMLAEPGIAPQMLPAHLNTQAQIIASRRTALKVVDTHELAAQARWIERFRSAGRGTQPIREWIAEQLLRALQVRTSKDSNIVRVFYTSSDAQTAAAMANAFAQAYIETSLELQVDPARRQASWLEGQVQQLRNELGEAQERLSAYQRDHGVLGIDEARIDVENARLQEISNQLVAAQAAMYEAENRERQLAAAARSNRLDELPEILKSPLLQSLKSELARAEAKLAETSERYDRNHPQYRSAAAETEALRARVAAELDIARGAVVQSAELARRQVAQIQQALDDQKSRIIALKRQRDELAVLSRNVESAKAAYDATLRQTIQTQLESRLDRTNTAVLTPAIAPVTPASPNALLSFLVAGALGVLFASGAALGLELLDRKVRHREDLLPLRVPVLAELPALPPQTHEARAPEPNTVAQPRIA